MECEHKWNEEGIIKGSPGQNGSGGIGKKGTRATQGYSKELTKDKSLGNTCVRCGAWRGQLGLEPHPQLYIEHLVECCRGFRRVLKPSGSFFLNMGDTYWGSGKGVWPGHEDESKEIYHLPQSSRPSQKQRSNWLQPKQLLLMPSRVAAALQHDGWVLRNDICWYKYNHMPSSVKDRLTNAWEHVFHFVKARRYYYDLDAIREPPRGHDLNDYPVYKNIFKINETAEKGSLEKGKQHGFKGRWLNPKGKNPGNMWSIPTRPFKGTHFACVDEDTEVLTKEGWKGIDEIGVSDEVCTLNILSGKLRYHRPYSIHRYDYDGEMVLLENRYCSQLVTPNHRVLLKYVHSNVKKRVDDEWRYIRAEEIRPFSGVRIPNAGHYEGEDEGIGVPFASLIGWIITDGSWHGNGIRIYQSITSNARKVEQIRSLLQKAGISFSEYYRQRQYRGKKYEMAQFYIKAKDGKKFKRWITEDKHPKWHLLHLPRDELEALYTAMIDADGSRRKDGRESFIQKDDYNREFFRVLALHLGKRTVEYKRTRETIRASVFVTQRSDCQIHTSDFHECVRRVKYSGRVWCPSLPNSNFVARRNKRIFITGNTFPPELVKRIVKAACPENGIVLDPFCGSGTALRVARELRRNWVGIDIVPEYVEMAKRNIEQPGYDPPPEDTPPLEEFLEEIIFEQGERS